MMEIQFPEMDVVLHVPMKEEILPLLERGVTVEMVRLNDQTQREYMRIVIRLLSGVSIVISHQPTHDRIFRDL